MVFIFLSPLAGGKKKGGKFLNLVCGWPGGIFVHHLGTRWPVMLFRALSGSYGRFGAVHITYFSGIRINLAGPSSASYNLWSRINFSQIYCVYAFIPGHSMFLRVCRPVINPRAQFFNKSDLSVELYYNLCVIPFAVYCNRFPSRIFGFRGGGELLHQGRVSRTVKRGCGPVLPRWYVTHMLIHPAQGRLSDLNGVRKEIQLTH